MLACFDLERAVRAADVISYAMAPWSWLRPETHLDLVTYFTIKQGMVYLDT